MAWTWSDVARAKHSATMKAVYADPALRAKQSALKKGLSMATEYRAKHSAAMKRAMSDPALRAKMRGIYSDPEWRARMSAALRKPETRAKLCAAAQRRNRPCLDHDHASDVIRAVLCGPCNQGAGFDCIKAVERRLAYLQYHVAHLGPHRWSELSARQRRELRRTLLNEQGGRCAICQKELIEWRG